jgi:hypothetical protein
MKPTKSKPTTKPTTSNSQKQWRQRGIADSYFNDDAYSVSVSADGSVVAIGAPFNDGNDSGQVRVYAWNSTSNIYVQRGADIDGESEGDWSGWSVSLSDDGSVIAIGALYNDGINGTDSGHVRVYAWDSTSNIYVQRGADIDGEAGGDCAYSVSVSADGSVVAIGALYNDGINGTDSGHVRVYAWDSTSNIYVQRGADINGEAANDLSGSGRSVSLSDDGSVIAIGALCNDGINGTDSGHVRVYAWNSTSNIYVQRGADINGEAARDESGRSVSLSADGRVVAIGAQYNDGNMYFRRLDHNTGPGHVRVYAWDSTSNIYVQRGADIDGESAYDEFGKSVSLSADGSVVAIGAPQNDGKSGHVRVYAWDSTSNIYVQRGADIDGESNFDSSGWSVSLSADGSVVAIGAGNNYGSGFLYNGAEAPYGTPRVYVWGN